VTASPWTFGDESEGRDAGAITLVNGTSFAICGASGDVGGPGTQGIYVADTRLCSMLKVLVDGVASEPLAVSVDEPSRATFVGRSADRTLIIRRILDVRRGADLQLHLENRTLEPRRADVVLAVGSDLADIFAVKEGRAGTRAAAVRTTTDGLRIGTDGRRAALVRAVDGAGVGGQAADSTLRWEVDLPSRGVWSCRVELTAIRDGEELDLEPSHSEWRLPPLPRPRIATDVVGLESAVHHAMADLEALRLVDAGRPGEAVVAAGAPWFMTLFGRDSLIAAWMALPFAPALSMSTARTLARLQGRRSDPATEEEPGRIIHEIRFGTGSSLRLDEAERYYGTADATPLFVMLVAELWRWGAAWHYIAALLPAVDAALAWMDGPGDPDHDGFIEYLRATPHGLANQGWKDSFDAIVFADGRRATAPIALSEVQGYAYAAWLGGAELAAAAGDLDVATERRRRAERVREKFHDAFWMADRGYFALALDADKRPVDALASNLGHLLWSGIVADEHAGAVAAALASPEMASGWGIRTLASSMVSYDPLGYHTGSVWPHDTAIAIAGLRRAGCTAEALELTSSLLAASRASGGRLPELFAGIPPAEIAVPVPYPASCSPQAWASAAPLLLLRTLLGLEPDVPGRRVVLDPALPDGATRLAVDGIAINARPASIEVDGDAVAVRNLPPGVAVVLLPRERAPVARRQGRWRTSS